MTHRQFNFLGLLEDQKVDRIEYRLRILLEKYKKKKPLVQRHTQYFSHTGLY